MRPSAPAFPVARKSCFCDAGAAGRGRGRPSPCCSSRYRFPKKGCARSGIPTHTPPPPTPDWIEDQESGVNTVHRSGARSSLHGFTQGVLVAGRLPCFSASLNVRDLIKVVLSAPGIPQAHCFFTQARGFMCKGSKRRTGSSGKVSGKAPVL